MRTIMVDKATFRYPEAPSPALTEARLTIDSGEFVLVTGQSGCGKTTLANLINGLVPHMREGRFDGRVTVAGLDTRSTSIGELGRHVGTVFQDPRTQFFTLNTSEEVAFGCRNHGLDRSRIAAQVAHSFDTLGIPQLADRDILGLSSGEKQKIALASCHALGPGIFLLDEPSANLDPDATVQLASVLDDLKRSGATIIVLEHRLHYLTGLFDRVVHLQDGRIRTVYDAADFRSLSGLELAALGLRCLDLSAVRRRARPDQGRTGPRHGATFSCENIGFRYRERAGSRRLPDETRRQRTGLSDVSLSAQAGEVIGIAGANGAGKTTLARVGAGLEREQTGRILLNGHPVSPRGRLGRVYLVAQDSAYQLFSDSVLGELRLGRGRNSAESEAADRRILTELGLWDHRDKHPAALSRGQQQRLTIAAALASDADVFFFDEPSSGLDHGAMTAVARSLIGLAQSGKIVFVISHDHELLAASCTRLITLDEGRVTADDSVFDESPGVPEASW
ncbi:ABC transporter ATP-binding protein [Micromonospora craniellae]|uniref:ATP-binding cassette domain-containing protein n=1 Tax=Micromonospora craniellae TaxID=2294034 RepID=A0A372FXS8_9ACTN|nr:ABC transporter ATP-binding protein [Micromonospora craniellae]RFS45602.1 ATP-binding cassette domain-containing protein [Micromonospora craniellae]